MDSILKGEKPNRPSRKKDAPRKRQPGEPLPIDEDLIAEANDPDAVFTRLFESIDELDLTVKELQTFVLKGKEPQADIAKAGEKIMEVYWQLQEMLVGQ